MPPGTLLLAGLDLSRIRSSPLAGKLPLVAPFAEAFHEASRLLIAYDGKDILIIASGPFQAAPAAGTLVQPGLALCGPAAAVGAAIERHRQGARAPSRLLDFAAASGQPIWIVAQGGATLPLTGNAANLNRLLRDSEFAGITASLGPSIQIEATAAARTPEAAGEVEGTLRAILGLMAMAEKRGSDTAALLGAVQIRRQDRTVHAAVAATPEALGKLLDSLSQ